MDVFHEGNTFHRRSGFLPPEGIPEFTPRELKKSHVVGVDVGVLLVQSCRWARISHQLTTWMPLVHIICPSRFFSHHQDDMTFFRLGDPKLKPTHLREGKRIRATFEVGWWNDICDVVFFYPSFDAYFFCFSFFSVMNSTSCLLSTSEWFCAHFIRASASHQRFMWQNRSMPSGSTPSWVSFHGFHRFTPLASLCEFIS